jgi:hypothetical protein
VKRRILRRRYGRALNPDLEVFRKQVIEKLKSEGRFLCDTASSVLGVPCRGVYVIGSVLDKNAFREESDVDVAFSVDGPSGLSTSLSSKLQDAMLSHPIGNFGVINTLVFEGKVTPKSGKTLRIWPRKA